MSLTDKNEQDRLKNWVTIKGDLDPFGRKETEGQDSFWIARTSEDSYIIDYDFDTIPEFENLCKEIIKVPMDIELERIISVAAFKNMPDENPEEIDNNVFEKNEKLPEYRYVF